MKKQSSSPESHDRKRLRRVLFVLLGVVLVLAIGAGVFLGYRSWRARDLAIKARESFDGGSYRLAWLQAKSARDIAPNDAEVLRSSAILDAGFGMRSALEYWDRLAGQGEMTAYDYDQRARAAARFGTDEEFEAAMTDLEKSGAPVSVGELRAGRLLVRGNTDRAIEEMRRLSAMSDDPAMRLDLARMLIRRHADTLADSRKEQSVAVARELFATVDTLQGTPLAEEALAFGLTYLLPGKEAQRKWAEAAMQNLSAKNPALLPAATVLVDIGSAKPEELNKKLRPLFDAAPLDRRAAYSAWLTKHGLAREALALITAQEAAETREAFAARVDALAATENWAAVIQTAEVNGNTPESIRFVTKARAEFAIGRGEQSGNKSVADAVRAASRQANLPLIIALSDEMGGGGSVDSTLVELCGDPAVAAQVFRLTRDRFARRGPDASALLTAAHERALASATTAVAVQDFSRYTKLLASLTAASGVGETSGTPQIDPTETAAALASEPSDIAIRATHALALMSAGRGNESAACFDDLTLEFGKLSPGTQAVYCAALAASGQRERAAELSGRIDRSLLSPAEAGLIRDLP